MSKTIKQLTELRQAIEDERKAVEQHIYDMETNYFKESEDFGNIVKGWEALLSNKQSKSSAMMRKPTTSRAIKDKDRIFTRSSFTMEQNLEVSLSELRLGTKRKNVEKKHIGSKRIKGKGYDYDNDPDYNEDN
mmetsp:Transcript_34340/g.60134  ORF Transcript_34340/g.60134 Transcript_34340/m.60134 type:complete len:133 (-) Transcript_34340:502-900(-)